MNKKSAFPLKRKTKSTSKTKHKKKLFKSNFQHLYDYKQAQGFQRKVFKNSIQKSNFTLPLNQNAPNTTKYLKRNSFSRESLQKRSRKSSLKKSKAKQN